MRAFGKLSSTFFISNVKIKIIYQKEAYFLHEADLKRKLIAEFDESISFFSSGKFAIVHSSDTNPCQYGVAFLQGSGLRDDDIVKSFDRFIKRKVCERINN